MKLKIFPFLLLLLISNTFYGQKLIKLKNGQILNVAEKSTEDFLFDFLTVGKIDSLSYANWFDLDKTKFELGKLTLTKEAKVQLKNIAALLINFEVKIKIGCYSDKKGNSDANLKLTEIRAKVVFNFLVKTGLNKVNITEAVGYGSKFAKYGENEIEELRLIDRRVAIKILGFN